MKEKLTLRNAILWTVSLVALILFFCSFGAKAKLSGVVEGNYVEISGKGAIWGCKSFFGMDYKGDTFYGVLSKAVGSAPGIIGAILLFLASGGLVVISFVLASKNEKLAKILTFVCAGLMLTAGILMFFVSGVVWKVYQQSVWDMNHVYVDIDTLKASMPGMKASSGYGVATGIISILLAGGLVASQFIPDKKFIK